MAFDPLNYNMVAPYAITQAGDLAEFYTTANVLKRYTPGQYAFLWDKLWGYRVFKLVKNLSGATLAKGDLVSYVAAASVGSITAGTTTSITTSGLTANDLEYQMITVSDDAGAAGAAPEGESSLCIANTATVITLDPMYAFSAAIGASDTASVVYINGVEDATANDERGLGHGSIGVAGVVFADATDNYWFWVLQRGWVTVKNTNSIVATYNVIAGEATIASAADGAQQIEIGQATVTQFAGNEESIGTVFIDVFNTICTTDTP